MEDLSRSCREVTVILKQLRDCDDLGEGFSEMGPVLRDVGGGRPSSRHERCPAWVAQGILTVGPFKADSFCCESIYIGRANDGVSIATEAAG